MRKNKIHVYALHCGTVGWHNIFKRKFKTQIISTMKNFLIYGISQMLFAGIGALSTDTTPETMTRILP